MPEGLTSEANVRGNVAPLVIGAIAANPVPTGRIQVPVLTLHNSRDPIAPQRHLDTFRAAVTAAGRSEWLAERTIDSFGHCNWSPSDELATFQQLVTWVETGVRPVP